MINGEEDNVNLQETLHAALSEALNPDGTTFVTKWVIAVERFTTDGRQISFVAGPDMQPWEIIGMTEMASEVARLQVQTEIVDELYAMGDDDDDDD